MGRLLNGTSETAAFVANPTGPLDITGPTIMISAWVKPPNNYWTANRMVVTKAIAGTVQYQLYLQNATGAAVFYPNNTESITSDVGIAWGVWTHLLAVKVGSAGANMLGIWINGVLHGVSASSAGIADTGQSFRIGTRDDGLYFSGIIAEVAVWSGVVNPSYLAPRLTAGFSPLAFTELLPYLRGYFPLWGAGPATEPNLAPWGANQVIDIAAGGVQAEHPPVVPAWLF